ncbi:c-type cytochrome biogenesis protein CcmI [Methylobacter sp.]|uniref:c-type cytochrome biogenesis protein CcmI n=1 Tax=Methylobacter sp. TaxID=2051955 RepID=UPI0024899372|nr:c-type cytochrome biogenesis protein CcmI [Methylobacter sp.]MDI1276805.1 c-type cytochrome biogenesis protein CcmI [Methylobacter sp.]MDI1357473.1 c-type cytochrome biogenesis protein CcmI [Methylobacter sp.]
MLFLLIGSVLILIAFLIVLPPLWRIPPAPPFSKRGEKDPLPPLAKGGWGGFADQDQRNIAIARQRLAELKEQLQAGALTQALYDEQLVELEQALSDDLDIDSHVNEAPSLGNRSLRCSTSCIHAVEGRWIALVLILAIPFVAGSLYWTLGNYQSLTQENQTAAANQAVPELEKMKSMVAGLAERLKEQPDDSMGWTMLGRSYKYLQQYPQAVDAFEHAYKLIGEQPEIMLLYADALAFSNNEQLAGKPSELVFKALAMEPNNVTGLWLGGMAKAQTGDFAAAMDLWTKLEAQLPQGSEAQQEIQVLLAKLATQMPEGAIQAEAKPVQPVATLPPSPAVASIDVQVSLAPELQQSANPGDTVFIYAQALSGPKMPLAIVRKQVSELPLTVNLTDAMAMMPTMKLSNFEQVKLLARISKSGDAMQQPGDLIGIIEQVALTDKSLKKIVINSSIK